MPIIPDWAPQNRDRWPARCTPTRDGWVKWYKGQTRFIAPKSVALADVEDEWFRVKREVDGLAAEVVEPSRIDRTYRAAISDFLISKKLRIGAGNKAIRERTYHNSAAALNAFGGFIVNGRKIADMNIREIGPSQFQAYADQFVKWKSSGFDSVVSRVSEFFNWAVKMEYIDRFRAGTFLRPGKEAIRSERIELAKSYTPDEVAQLYVAGNHTMRCFIALGVVAAFINSDIANVPRIAIDLETGVIDFRRLKKGKIRRVIPLPADVLNLLRDYERPEPTDEAWADLFFITTNGNPYSRPKSRTGKWMPSDSISRLFRELIVAAGVERKRGRNFTGLRTTHYNRAIAGKWEMERKIVMGRAKGDIDSDHYLEDVGIERLKHYTAFIWNHFKPKIDQLISGS
jgi:integrase